MHLAQGRVQRRPLVNIVLNMRDISGPGKPLSFSQEQDVVTDTGIHMPMANSDAAVECVSKRDVKVTASQHVSRCINKSSPHANIIEMLLHLSTGGSPYHDTRRSSHSLTAKPHKYRKGLHWTRYLVTPTICTLIFQSHMTFSF